MGELTPLVEQYQRIKKNYPEEILLFRLGDFYEMFNDDAVRASQTLSITLTKRQSGEIKFPMAGFPHHSADTYINRLLKAGYKVAICEQMEEARPGKLVDRQVTRIITPGTLIDESILNEVNTNYLASVFCARSGGSDSIGLAWLDLSTGSFYAEDLESTTELYDELNRIKPSECLLPSSQAERINFSKTLITQVPDYIFDNQTLLDHFQVIGLDGFGLKLKTAGYAAGAIIGYLKNTSRGPISHINKIQMVTRKDFMILDSNTLQSLKVTGRLVDGQNQGTLAWVLDKTNTKMGSRLLYEWLLSPLNRIDQIVNRLDGVDQLKSDADRKDLRLKLRTIQDLERLAGKIGTLRASPRDLVGLKISIKPLANIKSSISWFNTTILQNIHTQIDPLEDVQKLLDDSINEDAPTVLSEGGIIKAGYNQELDELRSLKDNSAKFLLELEQREKKRTGISNLRIGYNSVFGYYIEVTNSYKNKVPIDYVRRQTLKNLERYITSELKEHEAKILSAQTRTNQLEQRIFEQIRSQCQKELIRIQRSASAIAVLDVLLSLADVADQNNYIRPRIVSEPILKIEGSRHPVLEKTLSNFVPNDIDMEAKNIFLITGPNMAGKSTYIRQIALNCLMAQIGSFVPASKATIGIVDRIFTRIGSADEISRGLSTFMVEMNETANILNNATNSSLLILDEIGRGTSTFDGVSIAWAVVEYIHKNICARTLFATHFHELTALSDSLKGVQNFHASIQEHKKDVVFLYRILEGATDRSYGIHVAAMAGIPKEVIEKAKLVLSGLERLTRDKKSQVTQINLFDATAKPEINPLVEELKNLNIESLTPVEALNKLYELISKAKEY